MADNANQYEVSLEKLTQKVNELRSAEAKLKQQQQKLNEMYKQGKLNQQAYNKAMDGLNKGLEENKQQLQEVSKAVQNQSKSTKDVKKSTDEAKKSMDKFIGSAEGIERSLGAIWGIVQGGLQNIANAFDNYRQKMRDAFNEQMEKMKELQESEKELQQEMKDYYKERAEDASNDIINGDDRVKATEELTKRQKQANAEYTNAVKALNDYKKKSADVLKVQKAIQDNGWTNGWLKIDEDGSVDRDFTIGPNRRLITSWLRSANEATEKIQELEKNVNNAKKNLDKINDKRKEFDEKTKEDEDKAQAEREKKIEEEAKKRKEENDKVLADKKAKEDKAREEAQLADQEALKQLEDLQIQLIDDEEERQRQQILLTKRRTLNVLNELSKKASADGKKNIEELKKLLKGITLKDLEMMNVRQVNSQFEAFGVKVTEIMRDALVKPIEDDIRQLANQEEKLSKRRFKRRPIGGGAESTSEDDRTVIAGKNGERMLDKASEFAEIWTSTSENIQKLFGKSNVLNKWFEDSDEGAEAYKQYLDDLFLKMNNLINVYPKLDKNLALSVQEGVSETYKLKVAQEEALDAEKKSMTELIKAENDRFKTASANQIGLANAEKDRAKTVVEQLKAEEEADYQEKLSRAETLQQQNELQMEHNETIKRLDMDLSASTVQIDQKLKDTLLITEQNHQESINNIVQNSENKKRLIIRDTEEKIRAERQKTFETSLQFIGELSNVMSAFASLEQGIADDESESDSKRERARRRALNLQIASCYIAMALSVAEAIQTATSSSSNWIEMLVAIASSVATVVSQIAQVKSLMNQRNSGGYAEGGYVRGQGTGTSDSINTNLSNGEYVMRSSSVNSATLPILDTMNYGGANALATQFALALRSQPSPVVSVQTIDKVNTQYNKTKVYSHL